MSRFTSKQQFVDEIIKEQAKLDELLAQIPASRKTEEVTDGMSVKDFLAHRTEWGRMMIRWYTEAKAGNTPAVPTEKFKWNQLNELNHDIYERFENTSLNVVESDFADVQKQLLEIVKNTQKDELLEKKYYAFTGTSDLATYLNSATASHYRSARKYIAKWWKGMNQ